MDEEAQDEFGIHLTGDGVADNETVLLPSGEQIKREGMYRARIFVPL
jgi:hypothetical protein